MKLLKNVSTACGAVIVCAAANISAAKAGDLGYPASWSGFYIGLGGGYFNTESDLSHPLFTPSSSGTDGPLVGLYTGYNYQINSIVLGLEASAYVGFGGKTKLSGVGVPAIPAIFKSKEEASWSLRGRLGWASGQFMPYISGGYVGMTNKKTFGSGYVGSDSRTLQGWTIGGGAEYMLSPNWLLRLDYQYQDFADRRFFKTLFPPTGIKQKVNANQITFGVAYKF